MGRKIVGMAGRVTGPKGSWRRRWSIALSLLLAVGLVFVSSERPEAANPAADLDQCRNGAFATPVACVGSAWVNGNAGASNAHWSEGDSIAYRLRFSNLVPGTVYFIDIEWDTTQQGKHALDYLTSVDRTMNGMSGTTLYVDPCNGGVACDGTSADFDIPPDPVVQGLLPDSVPDGRWEEKFKMYNIGSGPNAAGITNIDAYALTGDYTGSSQTRLRIHFMSANSNPVLAWGAHIATRKDWGLGFSAVAINGSPFHMRLKSLNDASTGNQDRSLSNAAVIFPAILSVTKEVEDSSGNNGTFTLPDEFTFQTTSPNLPTGNPELPSPFSLWDNGSPAPPDPDPTPKTLPFNLFLFESGSTQNAVSVQEIPLPAGFNFGGVSCTRQDGGLGTGTVLTYDQTNRKVTLTAKEGEMISCTFTNEQAGASITVIKNLTKNNGGIADESAFTMHVKKTAGLDITGSPFAGSTTGTTLTVSPGSYDVSEVAVQFWTLASLVCTVSSGSTQSVSNGTATLVMAAGGTATCTFTNDDDAPSLTLVKKLITDSGRKASESDWTLTATGQNGASATSFSGAGPTVLSTTYHPTDFKMGSYDLSESTVAGFTGKGWVCTSGGNAHATTGGNGTTTATVSINLGQHVECTITNDDDINQTSLTTKQKWTLNDSATLTGLIAGAGGDITVEFKLYGPYNNADTCATFVSTGKTAAYTETKNLDDLTLTDPHVVSTTNGGYVTEVQGTFFWLVTSSANDFNQAANKCEQTVITADPAQNGP